MNELAARQTEPSERSLRAPDSARLQRPHVTIQAALTLDGKISLPEQRVLLSSPEGLEFAHRSRSQHDAVLVGSATVHIDDPRLSVRYFRGPQPKRVVLATTLNVSPRANVFGPGPGVMVIGVAGATTSHQVQVIQSAGAQVRLVPASDWGRVCLRHALAELHQWGVRRLLVEGGALVLSSFLRERLVDDVTLEIVPVLLGARGVPAVADIGVTALVEAPQLTCVEVTRIGTSILVQGRLEPVRDYDA